MVQGPTMLAELNHCCISQTPTCVRLMALIRTRPVPRGMYVSDRTEGDCQQTSIDGGGSRREEVMKDWVAPLTSTEEMQGRYEGGRSTDCEGYRNDGCRHNYWAGLVEGASTHQDGLITDVDCVATSVWGVRRLAPEWPYVIILIPIWKEEGGEGGHGIRTCLVASI